MPQNHITKELNKHLDHIDIDEATQVIDGNEIIDAVQDIVENEEEAEEDKCPSVSHKIALESIQNLLNYLQQSNNVSVSGSVLSGMKYVIFFISIFFL